MFSAVQIVANVLAFDVADGNTVALHDKVGGARIDMGGVVYGNDTIAAQCLNQCFKGRTVGMFGCPASPSFLGYGTAIGSQDGVGGLGCHGDHFCG